MSSLTNLTDSDLLDELIGPRKAQRVGEVVNLALRDILSYTDDQLRTCYRLPPKGARRLALAAEMHRRLTRAAMPNRASLRTPEDVFNLMGPRIGTNEIEEFYCLPLDSRSRLIGEPRVVSRGDVDGCEAGPRLFYRTALRSGAVSAIAVHPHPSGHCEPSSADRAVTKRLCEAGRQLDIPLVDHIVVTSASFCSLRRNSPELWHS